MLCASQAHLVAAFEKSLSNMTCRLQSLTMTAEQKVQELSSELGCELHGEGITGGEMIKYGSTVETSKVTMGGKGN